MNKEALRLAAHAEANAHFGDMKSIAAELRRLHDLLGKANALARIRKERIAELEEQLQSMVICFERWEDTNNALVMDAARAALEQPMQEPVILQCVHCGTVYAEGVPPAVPVQEPVAWTTMPDADDWMFVSGMEKPPLPGEWHPLYTHPPRREWVWLTKDEIAKLLSTHYIHMEDFVKEVEAKLKEKNHE